MEKETEVKAPEQVQSQKLGLHVHLMGRTHIKCLESVLPEGCWKQEGGSWSERSKEVGLPYHFNRALTKEEVLRITDFLYSLGDNVRDWVFRKYHF
jgi:hypothetical protein